MRFKSPLIGLLLLIALLHTHHVMAQTELPIELIELLGEIEDDDDMLGLALAEIDQKTNAATQKIGNKANKQQNPEIAAPAGGSKK